MEALNKWSMRQKENQRDMMPLKPSEEIFQERGNDQLCQPLLAVNKMKLKNNHWTWKHED